MLSYSLIDPQFMNKCRHNSGSNSNGFNSSSSQKKKKRSSSRSSNSRTGYEDCDLSEEDAARYSSYLSASRQVENLISTNRESLLGSGAWHGDFYMELQSRPFYSSARVMLCSSSSSSSSLSLSCMKCAACNRSSHQPDMQVIYMLN